LSFSIKEQRSATSRFRQSAPACFHGSGGAIDVAARACLPSSFTLLIESDRFIRGCRPVWRNERQGGVAFD
jgi:hypothetical protein